MLFNTLFCDKYPDIHYIYFTTVNFIKPTEIICRVDFPQSVAFQFKVAIQK